MQAQCSQCSARIQIDDSKVPDKPFKVKCPKCQAVITLPGRTAEVAVPPAPQAPAPASDAAASAPAPAYVPPAPAPAWGG